MISGHSEVTLSPDVRRIGGVCDPVNSGTQALLHCGMARPHTFANGECPAVFRDDPRTLQTHVYLDSADSFHDLGHVTHIGSAAPSQDQDMWKTLPKFGQLFSQLHRVSIVQLFGLVQFSMATP